MRTISCNFLVFWVRAPELFLLTFLNLCPRIFSSLRTKAVLDPKSRSVLLWGLVSQRGEQGSHVCGVTEKEYNCFSVCHWSALGTVSTKTGTERTTVFTHRQHAPSFSVTHPNLVHLAHGQEKYNFQWDFNVRKLK